MGRNSVKARIERQENRGRSLAKLGIKKLIGDPGAVNLIPQPTSCHVDLVGTVSDFPVCIEVKEHYTGKSEFPIKLEKVESIWIETAYTNKLDHKTNSFYFCLDYIEEKLYIYQLTEEAVRSARLEKNWVQSVCDTDKSRGVKGYDTLFFSKSKAIKTIDLKKEYADIKKIYPPIKTSNRRSRKKTIPRGRTPFD